MKIDKKPQTHVVPGGYVSFSTRNKELFYKIVKVTLKNQFTLDAGKVADQSHLDVLLGGKHINQYVELLNQ